MSKIRIDIKAMSELQEWDYKSEPQFEYSGMKYVWILCSVQMIEEKNKKEEIKEIFLPCRFYTFNRKVAIPDIYGNYARFRITGWRPLPKILESDKL